MISILGSDECASCTSVNQSLRHYAVNSPHAKARLLVLAMLADGLLDDAELNSLARYDMYAEIGITREEFSGVLCDFCADLEALPSDNQNYLLTPSVLEQLFGGVSDSSEQQRLLRMIFDIIRSDGYLSDSESDLFWNAVDHWKLGATDMRKALRHRPALGRSRTESQATA